MGISNRAPFTLITKKLFIIVFSLLFVLTSCVPGGGKTSNKRKTSKNATSDTPTDTTTPPIFTTSNNYFQNGTTTSTSNFQLPNGFDNTFYFRGNQVNQYIQNKDNSPQCLMVVFPQATGNQVFVGALNPKYIYNFELKSREDYFLVDPSNQSLNQNFCQTPGILNYISNNYGTYTYTFDMDTVCPSCIISSLSSSPVKVFSTGGLEVSDITTSTLKLNLITGIDPGGNTGGQSCTTSSECTTQGFDCCSFNQCVKDKQLRSDANTATPEYTQALLDIQANPAYIYNYPQFFHLCASNVPVIPTPTPIQDPSEDARKRFEELQQLYECTTPIEGEMGICSITYENATSFGSNIFDSGKDDRNFNTTYTGSNPLPTHSIYKVVHAGETLFENKSIITGMTIGPSGNGTGNDNFDDTQIITLTHTKAASAPNDDLTIKYKIDASCEKISNSLAKCYKVYVQGDNLSKVTDHYPASNDFNLPQYADTNKTISVTVDDTTKLQGTHWNLIQTTPARVQFIGTGLQVYDTQVIKVSFFVDLTSNPNAAISKFSALEEIKTKCKCADTTCRLKPYTDDQNNILDYVCSYPSNDQTTVPVQQTVLLDSKSVPQRYFDIEGVYQKNIDYTTPAQEGTEFKYINSDLLRPNNVDNYIGFSEIYGTLSPLSTAAKPAKEVSVVKGKTYDIFVNTGSFSTCYYCGTDYYSNIAKMFPQAYQQKGGGYIPQLSSNNPFSTAYRQDDMLFGRACWIPATMIPWSHAAQSDRQTQRLERQAAQHFLFANGYQRDWYGFDYGSVIGSFDGVTWFSIGTQRRIQASSTKLFVAINAYFGDQTLQNSYEIVVSDTSSVPNAGSSVSNDFESDGAECQKNHVCSNDSDCVANLGWEYACESITSISTKWPRFDANALEIPGVEDLVNLRTQFKASTGGTKRCVYRGRGAICKPSYNVASTNSYAGNDKLGLHACTYNSYCQSFTEGIPQEKFNDRITRFGKSVKVQNSSSLVPWSDEDTFGKGTKVLGRPYDWNGSASVPIDATEGLSNNQVTAICIPGRSPTNDTFLGSNQNKPSNSFLGDKVAGIGMTPTSTASNYLSSCSVLDSNGNYFFKDSAFQSQLLSNSETLLRAANQALPTNALSVFETILGTDIVKDFDTQQIESPTIQENRCLRAPGSVCFSDIDCAPSNFIASKVSTINPDDSSANSFLNKYEIKFWQEGLICGQDKTPEDDGFELKNNRCCRENNNKVTIGTPTNTGGTYDFYNNEVAGSTQPVGDPKRYSRFSTVYDLINSASTSGDHPALEQAPDDACSGTCTSSTSLDKQFNTFSKLAQRTCCSGHWVREFDKDDNGGGHTWGPGKMQNIPKESFRCLNWELCPLADAATMCPTEFSCEHVEDANDGNCLAKSYTTTGAQPYFDWLGTLELTGVPSVKVKTRDFSDVRCVVDPSSQTAAGVDTMPNLIKTPASSTAEYENGSGLRYYSATDSNNFETSNIKKIFSEDEITCCLPAGTTVDPGTPASRCCTGFINGVNNKCQLPDYTNVSLFMNRNISSTAKDENDSLFNSETGYLNSSADVIRIACQKDICASGRIRAGTSLTSLKINGKVSSDTRVNRFIDGDNEANQVNGMNKLYDAGLRWNTHIYCVPEDSELSGVIDCSNSF